MWGQAVENLVRDCALKAIANGKIAASDAHVENVKIRFGLVSLADTLKQCIDSMLYERLKDFALDRNEVAHRSADAYMSLVLQNGTVNKVEIWKLTAVKENAGGLYGELLDVHTKLLT